MKHTSFCIVSVIGGMLIGSALTLLLAPKSGEEMRGDIGDFIKKEIERMRCRCNEDGSPCNCPGQNE